MNVTPKQLEANKKNAKLGGVKTTEGKEKVKLNALKHGILSNTITEYEKDFNENIVKKLQEELNPVGALEEMLVERIAIYSFRLFRARKAEGEFMKATLEKEIRDFGFVELGKVIKKGYVPILPVEAIDQLQTIYMRYETSLENRLYKAMHELERLQMKRLGGNVSAPIAIDINQLENGFVS